MPSTSLTHAPPITESPQSSSQVRVRTKPRWLSFARQVHLYLGVFSAPALLFFAISGALQTFSLHETTRGSTYKPPGWIVMMGQIHKKQIAELPQRRPPTGTVNSATPGAPPDLQAATAGAKPNAGKPDRTAQPDRTAEPDRTHQPDRTAQPFNARPTHHPLPLKIFFLVVSLGFVSSVLTGVFMAYKYNRNGRLVTAALLAGAIVPIVLVFV